MRSRTGNLSIANVKGVGKGRRGREEEKGGWGVS